MVAKKLWELIQHYTGWNGTESSSWQNADHSNRCLSICSIVICITMVSENPRMCTNLLESSIVLWCCKKNCTFARVQILTSGKILPPSSFLRFRFAFIFWWSSCHAIISTTFLPFCIYAVNIVLVFANRCNLVLSETTIKDAITRSHVGTRTKLLFIACCTSYLDDRVIRRRPSRLSLTF